MADHVDSPPRILSLCAGIGGLDLGIELAFPGARTVCFVEREAACCQILASRMEEGRLAPAPVWTDLRTFDGTAWRGRVDLVAAGYPCQPFSLAGKGLAEKDPRHLWPEVRRIIAEARPTFVVLENVQGHVKRGLKQVLLDLHELGLDAEWGVYSASQAGAPHRRNRIFVLAYSRSGGLEVLRGSGLLDRERKAQRDDADGCLPKLAHSNHGGCSLEQQPRSSEEENRRGEEDLVASVRGDSRARGELADANCERPQGRNESEREGPYELPPWPPSPEGDWSDVPKYLWPATQPPVRRVADGVPVRVDQLRALGNAVVPQQAALALRDLMGRLPRRQP